MATPVSDILSLFLKYSVTNQFGQFDLKSVLFCIFLHNVSRTDFDNGYSLSTFCINEERKQTWNYLQNISHFVKASKVNFSIKLFYYMYLQAANSCNQ